MKNLLAAFLLATVVISSSAAEPPKPVTAAEEAAQARKEYAEFLAQVITAENVADLVAVMDRVIDEAEHGLVDKQPDPGLVEATSKSGLRIEFSTTDAKQAIIYYLKISRGGPELRYDDAVKFAALFTDRAGLPHPLDITEGDKSTFAVRWLFKPSDWKKFLKQIKKARAENRAEKNLAQAFLKAVERELEARAAIQQGH
ncbi:MAG: hypothetical protein QM715_03805 [Nibricoccus sp.]